MANPLAALFPPWRFGNSVKSAEDHDIDSLSEGAVIAEWCFAALVIFGVAGEFIIACLNPPNECWLGRWGPAYADFLVAIGVAGEVIASVISHICQSELTRRTSVDLTAALDRATALEKITARRHVSAEAKEKLAELVADISDTIDLLIDFQRDDHEAYTYAVELWGAFNTAGVSKIRVLANSYLSGTVFGTWVSAELPIVVGPQIVSILNGTAPPVGWYLSDSSKQITRGQPSNLYIFVGPRVAPSEQAIVTASTQPGKKAGGWGR